MSKNKKICAAALLCAASLAFSAFGASAAEMTGARLSGDDGQGVVGDVDGDGSATSSDALMILRHSVGLSVLSEEQLKTADIDSDNEVTSSDALSVLRISVGIKEGNGMEMARSAAADAVSAVENGDFREIIYRTTSSIPGHETWRGLICLILSLDEDNEDLKKYDLNDVNVYDDMIADSYTDSDINQLMYLINFFPLEMGTEKFGNKCPKIEFTGGEQVNVSYDDLMGEIRAYQEQLPKYSVITLGEGVTMEPSEGTIEYPLNGRTVYISPVNSEGTIDIDTGEPQKVQLGNMYKFNVKIDGKDTGKTVRVVFMDGKYRIMDSDLMSII